MLLEKGFELLENGFVLDAAGTLEKGLVLGSEFGAEALDPKDPTFNPSLFPVSSPTEADVADIAPKGLNLVGEFSSDKEAPKAGRSPNGEPPVTSGPSIDCRLGLGKRESVLPLASSLSAGSIDLGKIGAPLLDEGVEGCFDMPAPGDWEALLNGLELPGDMPKELLS